MRFSERTPTCSGTIKSGLSIPGWRRLPCASPATGSAVLMFYKQDLTVSEIAGILGVTNGTIKTFLHRGRMHLRTRLETYGGTP